MTVAIGIIGCKNAGKTTLIEGLLKEFASRGLRAATIKHDAHDFEIDIPGKDTWRHRAAGSKLTIIASASKIALVRENEREAELHELLQFVDDSFDLVLVEGMRNSPLPKILVRRSGAGDDPPGIQGEILAVVSGDAEAASRTGLFRPDDAAALADLIQERLLNKEAMTA
ncbi:MAG: molybdopterin-guanine dinucleotide biosynthesis protein B [Chloroflexi bacterium]|nr:molybdopterin-guanine dinucleotide biosynthesis protein B [Chloroflexota bacterium]